MIGALLGDGLKNVAHYAVAFYFGSVIAAPGRALGQAAMPRPAPESLTDAQSGGLGIVMIHSFSDTLRYRRDDGLNRLTFAVRW